MNAFKSTALHTIELAVSLIAAYLVLNFLGADTETTTTVLGIAIAAMMKFARASDASSLPDYVNE